MSFEFAVLCQRSRLPTPAQWNEALREDGFDVTLEEFVWTEQAGYLPARLHGVSSGFELYVDQGPALAQWAESAGIAVPATLDVAVTARLGSRHLEMVTATLALSTLARIAGGCLADDGSVRPAADAMDEARDLAVRTAVQIARLDAPVAPRPWNCPGLLPWETPSSRQLVLDAMVRAKDIREERQEETVAYRLHALRARALRSELGIPESDGSGGAPTEGVKIVQGDLLDQDVDVIVNAWNRNFIPWWLLIPCGVAGAIRRRGGTRPFRELSRVGVMRLGQAALTSAGRLPHKGIIHVAALTWYWRSNERAVREGTINAYTLAADSGFTSIAFPLLGSGTGGMKRERAKRIMLDALSSCDRGVRAILVEFDKRSKRVQTAPPASEALQ